MGVLADSRTRTTVLFLLQQNPKQDRRSAATGAIEATKSNSLMTVSSLTLSNTSPASASRANVSVKVSNVLVRKASGAKPCKVNGIRVTDEMSGYGTSQPHHTRKEVWTRTGIIISLGTLCAMLQSRPTHPHLPILAAQLFIEREDEMVGREVKSAIALRSASGAQYAVHLRCQYT